MERALTEQLKERQEMEKKLQKLAKTMDYLERAKREEAAPLIEAAYLVEEREFYERKQQGEVLGRERHESDLRLSRMLDNKTSSDTNEEGSISEAEKFSSVEPEESKSQHDTVPMDKSCAIIDGKERQAFPLSSEKFQHSSQDGAPTLSLTSSDANEEGSFSKAEKVSSVEFEESKSQHDTVPMHKLETQLTGLTIEEEIQAHIWIKALSNPLLGIQEKTAIAEAVIASSKAVQEKVNESLKIIFWEKDELAWKKEQKRKKEERKEKKKEDKRKEEEKRSNKKTHPNQKKK